MRFQPKLLLFAFPLLILLVALFPFGWLGQFSPAFDAFMTWAFPEPWGHFFGHFTIFLLVGLSLLFAFPKLRFSPWLYASLILAVAFGQEFFQLLYKRRAIVLNDITDLIPDLIGASIAWLIIRAITARKQLMATTNLK